MTPSPVVAQIRLDAIRRNVTAIRARTKPGTPIIAAVKADAYGHGLAQVLPALADARVERIAVAHLEEAWVCRQRGWAGPILCFGPELLGVDERERHERAVEAVAAEVACTVSALPEARALARAAARLRRTARIEVQIDTGMGRMGVLPEEGENLVSEIADLDHVAIESVYTHFATADEPDLSSAREQRQRFSDVIDRLRQRSLSVRAYHAANSAAVFRLPESHFDRVRPGLAIYGLWGGPPEERPPDLEPALRLVSRLSDVRRLPAGHGVGYGSTFVTPRDGLIGIVPVGYGDGYPRALGNAGVMTLDGVRGRPPRVVPVVGRVSMDQVTVDLTDVGDARPGDPITVITDDPAAPNSVEHLARQLDTIPYEITCRISPRVRRIAL